MYRQVRIFAPQADVPFDNEFWVETVIGSIIKPSVDNAEGLEWFWFSRYDCTPEEDSDDCDITKIGKDFQNAQTGHYRSVRFRYSIEDAKADEHEKNCRLLIEKVRCRISDFLPFKIETLGDNRHLGGDRSAVRQTNRANLVACLYHAVSRTVIDALTGPDAKCRFSVAHNDHGQNPLGSSFQTLHHLFCNITDVPLAVTVSLQTAWMAQATGGQVRIRY
jgi:hypothetical protein